MKTICSPFPRMNTEELKLEFGKYIKKHRAAKGYTQQELADMLGVTPKSVSCTERGETFPCYENIFRMSEILDMSLDEFIYGHRRFYNTLSLKEINVMLDALNPEEQGLVLCILKATCESILKKQSLN